MKRVEGQLFDEKCRQPQTSIVKYKSTNFIQQKSETMLEFIIAMRINTVYQHDFFKILLHLNFINCFKLLVINIFVISLIKIIIFFPSLLEIEVSKLNLFDFKFSSIL